MPCHTTAAEPPENGTRFGTMVAVQDTREVPDEHKAAVAAAMDDRMRAALYKVWASRARRP
ncbi:hypothetical protein [Streptomyces sp. NBC_01602]|uniref:hypothetical protein n=1 Tax=Streptomyces sp. NBC_01602 TaxID=2975893 RepID=UPI003870DA78|nr:hypothetical protein OG955_00040 [Streptomyces sp. NBC_01602]